MHDFDNDIISVLDQDQSLSMTLSDGWGINGTANGGYIMALLTRAMDPESRDISSGSNKETENRAAIVTANYLGRCELTYPRNKVETTGDARTFVR